MSEFFSFTLGGVETIDQFNARVAQFCRENIVVDVFPSCSGQTLALSLTEPDDLPFPLPFAYQPYVLVANKADMPSLEKQLDAVSGKLIESIAAANDLDEEDLNVTRTMLISMPGEVDQTFIMMLVVIGAVEASGE